MFIVLDCLPLHCVVIGVVRSLAFYSLAFTPASLSPIALRCAFPRFRSVFTSYHFAVISFLFFFPLSYATYMIHTFFVLVHIVFDRRGSIGPLGERWHDWHKRKTGRTYRVCLKLPRPFQRSATFSDSRGFNPQWGGRWRPTGPYAYKDIQYNTIQYYEDRNTWNMWIRGASGSPIAHLCVRRWLWCGQRGTETARERK